MANITLDSIETGYRVDAKNTDVDVYTKTRVDVADGAYVHTDAVYSAMINAAAVMENRLAISLKNYQEHPDIQANLQQLQYDLQSWNIALSTMTNIQKNMADALKSITSNFR